MTIIMGKILTEPGRSQVGTFRADEVSLTIDVADDRVRAKIRRGMEKRWLVDDDPILTPGMYRDRGTFVKPENVETLDSFYDMLESTGFVATDMLLQDENEEG